MKPRLSAEVSELLGIRGCGRRILEILERRRDGLTLQNLVRATRRSERSIREHIKRLRRLSLIKVIEVKTKNNRRGHLYLAPSPDEIVDALKRLVDEKIGTWKNR
ncbi:MAG: HTH domain-containing protein [Candidatus Hadarchaeales archaeon]